VPLADWNTSSRRVEVGADGGSLYATWAAGPTTDSTCIPTLADHQRERLMIRSGKLRLSVTKAPAAHGDIACVCNIRLSAEADDPAASVALWRAGRIFLCGHVL